MSYDRTQPLTLKIMRQQLGGLLREITIGTVDSATSTTITDADLIDSGESATVYDRAWLRVSDTTRRIVNKGYDPATGTVTIGRAFSTAPVAGDEYELHTMISPTELDECINRALTSLYYEREQAITVVADQTEYDLSSYNWIVGREQVLGVYVRTGTTVNQYRYKSLPKWGMGRKPAASTASNAMPDTGLYLQVSALGDTDSSIIIVGMCPYDKLSSDSSATTAPYDWVMAAAEFQVYDLQIRDAPSTDRKIYEEKMRLVGTRLTVLNRQYMPRPRVIVTPLDYVSTNTLSEYGE